MGGITDFLTNFGQRAADLQPGGIKLPGIMPGFGGGTYNPDGTQATPPQDNIGMGPGVTVNGDGWKPRKPTILGALADAYLVSQHMQPAFAINRDQANIQGAMEGFTDDPLNAIRRISMIRGHGNDAWNMYNTYMDNNRADRTAESLDDSRGEKYLTRIGGMLNAVNHSKDPAASYARMLPTIRQYAAKRRVDVSDLPETYDPDMVGNYINGSVSPEDQMKMTALDEYRDARLRQIDTAEQGRNARNEQNEGGRNARAATAEQGRNTRANQAEAGRNARSNRPRVVNTPRGAMELSPSGLTGKLGNQIWTTTDGVHWKRVK